MEGGVRGSLLHNGKVSNVTAHREVPIGLSSARRSGRLRRTDRCGAWVLARSCLLLACSASDSIRVEAGTAAEVGVPIDSTPPPMLGWRDPIGEPMVADEGTTGGVYWRLETTGAENDGGCVRVVTDPALDGEVVRIDVDGLSISTAVPAGEAIAPSCGPRPLERDDDGNVRFSSALLLAVGGREADVHYIAGLLGDGTDAAVVFTDGRRVTLNSVDGAFVLVWQGESWPEVLETPNAVCELQADSSISGEDLVCG